jgi:hypothetical protein
MPRIDRAAHQEASRFYATYMLWSYIGSNNSDGSTGRGERRHHRSDRLSSTQAPICLISPLYGVEMVSQPSSLCRERTEFLLEFCEALVESLKATNDL